jgi:hypothetical protein
MHLRNLINTLLRFEIASSNSRDWRRNNKSFLGISWRLWKEVWSRGVTSAGITVYNLVETLCRFKLTNYKDAGWKFGSYLDDRICDFVDNYIKRRE